MKKLIFLLLVILGTAMCPAEAAPVASGDGPMCVSTGNASVNISYNNANGSYYASFYNYNDYMVTVTWIVWGTDSAGKTRKVAGGVKSVGANVNQGVSVYFSCPKDVDGLWVEADVKKCN